MQTGTTREGKISRHDHTTVDQKEMQFHTKGSEERVAICARYSTISHVFFVQTGLRYRSIETVEGQVVRRRRRRKGPCTDKGMA